MAALKKYGLTITMLFLSLFSLNAQSGKTFKVNAYGVNMNYSNDRSKIKSNELASNVLRIVNNTNKDISFTLLISPPGFYFKNISF